MRILNDIQESLLKDERKLLSDLRASLMPFGASQEDQLTLGQSIHQLDELFLLVVVGEERPNQRPVGSEASQGGRHAYNDANQHPALWRDPGTLGGE